MSDILGLINLQCPNTMKELSEKRPLASEPFGAKFLVPSSVSWTLR